MMMELNVFLRQTRDYVQGTQMIARSAEAMGAGWVFEQALFSTITDSPVALVSHDQIDDSSDVIGRLVFSKRNETCLFHLTKCVGQAPRLSTPLPVSVAFEAETPDQVVYLYKGMSDFEALLNVMVQVVKSEHERLFPSSHDVWLTGFRGFKLATDIQTVETNGSVLLRRGRLMGGQGVYQTLWTLQVMNAGRELAAGMTSFAFKSLEASSVD